MRRAWNIQDAAKRQLSAARHQGGSGLARLLLALTTSPWQAPAGLGRPLIDHIDNLRLSGWIARQAHMRNYLLWRNGAMRRLGRPVLVFPLFSERVRRRVVTILVVSDLLAAERRAAPPQPSSRLAENTGLSLLRKPDWSRSNWRNWPSPC